MLTLPYKYSIVNMKDIVSVLILILSCCSAFGQRGFYATDKKAFVGVKIIDKGRIENARWCVVNRGNKIEKYSPNDVVTYGFSERRTYVSKKITYSGFSDNFFLEQLTKGELSLFYFADKNHQTYFIEKDSTSFFELPKGEKNDNSYFQKQLQIIGSDFPEIYNNAKLVHYNRRALSKFINEYNNRLYEPFPYFKIGFVGLTEMSKYVIPANASYGNIDHITYNYDNAFGGGVFTDIPIDVSHLSYHMELLFSKHTHSFSTETINGIIDFVSNISSVKVPILLRYTYPTKKISPFFNAGAIIAYNTNKNVKLYETKYAENVIDIEDITHESLIADSQSGVSSGLGIEYRLHYKHSLFLEVRINEFFGNNKGLNSRDIQILTGFNF